MQSNIKKILVIYPMIFLLCMSFIGVNAKADEKVYNQESVTTTNNQNSENNNLKDTKVDNVNTNGNQTNITENKEADSTSSVGSTTDVDQNISETGQDDIVTNNDETKENSNEELNEEVVDEDAEEEVVEETLPAWKNIDGKLHYVTEDGIVERKGWFKEKYENPDADNENEYYLDKDHAATIGWKEIKGSWYYFNEAGIKQTGWHLIGYSWYYLDIDGVMQTGWIYNDGNKYYLNNEGIMAMGKKYIEDNWYFFGNTGILQTKVYRNGAKNYYSTKDGIMVSNEWITINDNKYYIKADSSFATGNAIINNVMETFDNSGKYIGAGKMEDHLFIKYLSVGDADCAFIKLPNGETVLIDTGDVKTSQKVIDFLNSQGLKEEADKSVIDYIIITHGHSDHIGGLAAILNEFKVKKVYMPDIAKMKNWYSDVKITKQNAADVEMMKYDYQVYKDSVKAMKKNKIKFTDTKNGEFIDENEILQFVQSDRNFGPLGADKVTADYWGINENSAIVYLNYGDLQALFTADMEWKSEKYFWANDLLDGRAVDILKVPHHGNDTSSTGYFIEYLKPTMGVISRAQESVKKNTAYNTLISDGVSLYETSEKDGVSIYATEKNWTVGN